MTLAVFPTSSVLAWSVFKSPNYATRTQRSISGRELRINDYFFPLYTFTLTWDVMRDRWDNRQGTGDAFDPSGAVYDELRQVWNFYIQHQGSNILFQFNDPSDNTTRANPNVAQSVNFGTGNGITTSFQMASALLAPIVPIGINSTIPGSPYNVDEFGIITFTVPPANGAPVGADMTYNYKVRFADDSLEAENFMYQLWRMKQLKLVSVLDTFF